MFKRFVVSTALVALFISTLPLTTTLADGPVLDPRHNAFVAMYGTGDWVGPNGFEIFHSGEVTVRSSYDEYTGFTEDRLLVYIPEVEGERPYYDLTVEMVDGECCGFATRHPFNRQGTPGFDLSETAKGNNWLIAAFGVFHFRSLTLSPFFVQTGEVTLIIFIQQGKSYNTPGPEYFNPLNPFTAGVILIY